jgi:hypothetical protein
MKINLNNVYSVYSIYINIWLLDLGGGGGNANDIFQLNVAEMKAVLGSATV